MGVYLDMAKIAKNSNVAGKGRIGGRAKGTPNKTTRAAKEAIEYAAAGIGGADRLKAWIQEDKKNEHAFWVSVYPKLLPLQLEHSGHIAHEMTLDELA